MLLWEIRMYIVNTDSLPQDKLYKCNGIIANWLMKEKSVPLLGKSKTGEYVFSKTELLDEVLKNLPFYFNITKIFS